MQIKVLALLAGCVLLAGCADATVPTAAPEQASFADQIAAAISEAEAGGASSAQIAILRQAQSEGELSLESARAAARAGVECVNGAGSVAFYQEYAEGSGLVIPGYSSSATTGEEEAIASRCETQEDYWVNWVYQMQPASLDVRNEYLDQQVPLVRNCLERNGYTVLVGATTFEVLRQAAQVQQETDWAVDCLTEAQIDGF